MSTLDCGNLDTYLLDRSSVLCALSIRQLQLKRAGLLPQNSLPVKCKAGHDMTPIKPLRRNRIHMLLHLVIYMSSSSQKNYSIHICLLESIRKTIIIIYFLILYRFSIIVLLNEERFLYNQSFLIEISYCYVSHLSFILRQRKVILYSLFFVYFASLNTQLLHPFFFV